MTSIERTAYPRVNPNHSPKAQELLELYSLTPDELRYVKKYVRGDTMRLNFAVQLKLFQRLGYFPILKHIPKRVVGHIKKCLKLNDETIMLGYDHDRSKNRHQERICDYLKITRWNKLDNFTDNKVLHPGRRFAIETAYNAAQTMNHPADIINVVIEELINHHYELPPFNQLNKIVKRSRARVNQKIYNSLYEQINDNLVKRIDELFVIKPGHARTGYHALKRLPKSATITHFKELLNHYHWLMGFGKIELYLQDISKVKLQQFSVEAKSLDASDFSDMNKPRYYALILCLLHCAQQKIKDSLAIMYSKTISKVHKRARMKLDLLRDKEEQKIKNVVGAFRDIVGACKEYPTAYSKLGENVINTMGEHGGVDFLHEECEAIHALYDDKHFPLLWSFFASNRKVLFELATVLNLQSIDDEDALLKALSVALSNIDSNNKYLIEDVDLSFAPDYWQEFMIENTNQGDLINRRHFELAIFSCVADKLKIGNIFIEGADIYSDYRKELLSWNLCEGQLSEFCHQANIEKNAKSFIQSLKTRLTETANRVDRSYPDIAELVINDDGIPVLKRRAAKKRTKQAILLENEVKRRIPERNLLDILCNAHHYAEWAFDFGPITGFDAKIKNPIERYIATHFAYGTRMGPTQTSKHLKVDISSHMLSWINRRHITPELLDKAIRRLINCYSNFQLPKAWGTGKTSAFDGTLCYIREDNLIAEHHIRYGHRGGIAYHHVSDQYIALFSTFIPCGVWEAVEIIDALLKNESEIQPDTIHADTQGQSTAVFALSYLFGIKLMPRIRNWKDLRLFRPEDETEYEHIDSLFSKHSINWGLIESYWQDLMQIALSIKSGRLSASVLLRKLNSYNRKNNLFRAFQELGYVIRTIFLLEYISSIELREKITAETNKVEQYNQLCDWVSFGAIELVASNDENEMEKAVKYCDVITNAIILQNIIDMSSIIHELALEGFEIRQDDIAFLSPYITEHIKRFGDYYIDISQIPAQVQQEARDLPSVRWFQQAA